MSIIPREHQRASVEMATHTWRERGKHTSKKGMRKLRFSQTAVMMDEIKRKSQRFYRKQVGYVCDLAPNLHVRNLPRAQAQLFPTCHRCTTSGHPPPTTRRLWSIFSSAQTDTTPTQLNIIVDWSRYKVGRVMFHHYVRGCCTRTATIWTTKGRK